MSEIATATYPLLCDCPLGYEGESETGWLLLPDGDVHLHRACFTCHRHLPQPADAVVDGCPICARLAAGEPTWWFYDDSITRRPPATRDDLLRAQLRCGECVCPEDRHGPDGKCLDAACVQYGHCETGYRLPAVAQARPS